MVSMACGSAHIERALIVEFEWPISSLLGLEYDDVLRSQAREAFRSVPHCRSEFSFYDFNHALIEQLTGESLAEQQMVKVTIRPRVEVEYLQAFSGSSLSAEEVLIQGISPAKPILKAALA